MKNITITFILARTKSNYSDIHKTGIYRIYHVDKPDIFYIGSATSNKRWREGFKQRWICHIKELKSNSHHSPFLQRVVDKYGIEGLRFDIIEICSYEQCLEREQYWLDTVKPFGNKGYNTLTIAGNSLGYLFPEDKKSKRKSINQYSLDGKFIREWNSLNEASRHLNINVSSIKDCCKKRFKQIKGYVFRYKGDNELPDYTEFKIPMKIKCIYNNSVLYIGSFSEIKSLVPDSRASIYNSIKKGILTKNKYMYKKLENE